MPRTQDRIITCRDCGRARPHQARGLCNPCYARHQYRGTLVDFERICRPRDELLEDWRLLEADGCTRRQAAERLGVTRAALDKAIERERNSQAVAA